MDSNDVYDNNPVWADHRQPPRPRREQWIWTTCARPRRRRSSLWLNLKIGSEGVGKPGNMVRKSI